MIKNLLLLACLLAACTNPPYRGSDVVGADEFVMDSYKIREGKFSILEMEGKAVEAFSNTLLEEYKDVVHEGDLLQIMVYHPTRADVSTSVQQIGSGVGFCVVDGKVHLPDLEPIEVANLSLEEARSAIQAKYHEQFKDAEIFLSYKERTKRKVELAGLVQIPSLPVDGRLRLFEALSLARVPPAANLFKSYVVRQGTLLPVDLYKLVKEGDMSQNIVLHGGDKIYVADASASNLMVLGEVGQQRLVDLPNGFMTLRQALAEAKGLQLTGDTSYIQVIRGNILHPKIYTLNWQHVARLPSDSMLLIPGDIVYVAARPLAQWNWFVSQVLPTLIGIDLVTKGVKTIGVNAP